MILSKDRKAFIICTLVLIFTLTLAIPIFPAEASSKLIKVEIVEGKAGSRATLDVIASSIEMSGYSLVIEYDPEFLNPVSASSYLADDNFSSNLNYAPGKMAFVWYLPVEGPEPDTTVVANRMFSITFDVIKSLSYTSMVSVVADDDLTEVLDEDLKKIDVRFGTGGVRPEGSPAEDCYIATAVYGDYNAGEVLVLRNFRDEVLQKSFLGRLFVQVYYKLSPPVASYLENAEKLNGWVKSLLDKFVDYLSE